MQPRLDFKITHPVAYRAMLEMENVIKNSTINKVQLELLKIRASHLNGCAFCIDMHAKEALRLGVSEQKIYLLTAWKEAGNIYSEEEQLVLQMTEEITMIHQKGLSDDVYEKAVASFGEVKTTELMLAIVTINAWNRLMMATHKKTTIAI